MPMVYQQRLNPAQESGEMRTLSATYDVFRDTVVFSYKPSLAVQRTTSFRTGKAVEGERTEDDIILGARTWADASRRIRATTDVKSSSHDTGHPFFTEKLQWIRPDPKGYSGSGGRYGPLIPRTGSSLDMKGMDDTSYESSLPSLAQQGSRAIASTLPTRTPASLAEALIELKREGLPKVKRALTNAIGAQSWTQAARGLAEVNLVTQFGVKPILADLMAAVDVINNREELLKKFEEGAGKKQHRRRVFDPIASYSSFESTDPNHCRVANFHDISARNMGLESNIGTATSTTWSTSVKDVFSGCYVYYLPPLSSGLQQALREFRYLTGLEPSYSAVWEVTPWSWLADWVGSFGDNIAACEALRDDGLVLLYGYMMRHVTRTCTRTLHGLRRSTGEAIGPVTIVRRYESKERIRATPYGFGLDTGGFTARQWSILGSLGLTRADGALRLND